MANLSTPQLDAACTVVYEFMKVALHTSHVTFTAAVEVNDDGKVTIEAEDRFRALVEGLIHELRKVMD